MTLELRYLYGTLTANNKSRFDIDGNGIINEVDYIIVKDYVVGNMMN